MKQVFVLLFSFGIAAAAWSQTNPNVAEEKFVLLKVTEKNGKVTAVDTVMVNTTGTMQFDDFQLIGSAAAFSPNSHQLHIAMDDLDSLTAFDYDKVYVSKGVDVHAYSGQISNALSELLFSVDTEDHLSSSLKKEVEILKEKVEKMVREMEVRFNKLEKEN